jgi:hypothetical protein
MAIFKNVRAAPPIAHAIAPNTTSLPHASTAAPYPAASMTTHHAMLTYGNSPAPGLIPFWQHRQTHGAPAPNIWSLGPMPEMGFGHQH